MTPNAADRPSGPAPVAPVIAGYHTLDPRPAGGATLSYRAMREADGTPVVLRMPRNTYVTPRETARYQLEYDILAALDSSGAPRVHELTSYEGRPVIVFEDVGGQTLAELLRKRPLAVAEALEIAVELAGTLDELHRAGIVHCGVNPTCTEVVPDGGRVALSDFSSATHLSGLRTAPWGGGLPEDRLPYLAPEQTGRMNRSVDDRSDLYSLGVTLYEMLTGSPPFSSDDPLELVYAHIATPPVPPAEANPAVPATLSDIVLKLTAKNAEDRYQSALGVRTDLEEALRRWRATGSIDPFPLGEHDPPRELRVPERLYGREREQTVLLDAIDRSREGAELLLVSGVPGIGKTTLVNESHRHLARHHGLFLSGKVDPLQRTVPYAALAQAIRGWVGQVLTEHESSLTVWRDRLLDALGSNVGLISELVPDLEQIVGTQLPAPSVTPLDAQNQLRLAFRQFLQVLARPEHPLVVFLDDLQWADTAMLHLLESVLSAGDVRHLLVIGAYRDNEVSDVHPLRQSLDDIAAEGTRIEEIRLGPLSEGNVTQLIADTLTCSIEAAAALAMLVAAKTDGNPFFVREFLRTLHDDGHLEFDLAGGRWTWDEDRLQSLHMTSNVVELVADRVRQLDERSLTTVKAAAVIGGQFELGLLAELVAMTPRETAVILNETIRQRIVVPLSEAHGLAERTEALPGEERSFEYGFGHDRVQQAVYSIVDDAELETLHLRLARLLQEHDSPGEHGRVFDIANHLHLARRLLVAPEEQDEYARLNRDAGRDARATSAFGVASEYYRRGIEAFGAEGWRRDYELARDLRLEGAEAAYLSGDLDETTEWTAAVLRHGTTESDRVRAYEIRVAAATTRGEADLAVMEGLQLLRRLGVRIATAPTKRDVLIGFAATKAAIGIKKVEDLVDLPEMSDERDLTTMRLLQLVSAAAYTARPDVFPLLVFRSVILSVKRGNSPLATQGYLGFGIILCGVTGDVSQGYQFGELALTLLRRFDARPLRPRTLFLFNAFIAHWRNHYRTTFADLKEAYRLGLEGGDFHFAGLAAFDYTFQAYWSGEKLDELELELAGYKDVFRSLQQHIIVRLLDLYRQAALNLVEGGDQPDVLTGDCCDEDEMVSVLEATHDINALCQLHLHKLILAYLFKRHEAASVHAEAAAEHLEGLTATQGVPIYHFYSALNVLSRAGRGFDGFGEDAGAQRKLVRNALKKLRKWAASAPMNYAHRVHLLEAELARVRGRHAAAREHYDQAIVLAGKHQFLNDAALASELAGRHHLERGLAHMARAYLRDAHHGYLRWGAVALARELEASFPQYTGHADLSSIDSDSPRAQVEAPELDLTSVLRASQAVSSEVELPALLRRLMTVVMQNAGARRGCLILEHQGGLFVEAEVTVDSPDVNVLQSVPVETTEVGQSGLPLSIVNVVKHTHESVVLDDAVSDARFGHDPYVVRARPRSVLCTPLLRLGRLTGLLYLENDLNQAAFTPARTSLVSHVAAQAAISVDNARLFGDIRALNSASERFLPRQFLGILDRDAITDVELGDHVDREMTVLFSDIRGFTSLSESMGPDETFAFLNRYLGTMVPAIEERHGIVDKYMGDSIVALFARQPDDALHAAIAMQHRLAQLNVDLAAEGLPTLQAGTGLHYGRVMLGTIGAQRRMDGTVIGDAVNVASRVQSSTTGYGMPLLATSQLCDRLEFPNHFALREIDRVRVAGREEPLTLFEAFDADPDHLVAAKRDTAALLADLIGHYRAGRLDEAAGCASEMIAHAPHDRVAQLYLSRCERHRGAVPADWDGVETLAGKEGPVTSPGTAVVSDTAGRSAISTDTPG